MRATATTARRHDRSESRWPTAPNTAIAGPGPTLKPSAMQIAARPSTAVRADVASCCARRAGLEQADGGRRDGQHDRDQQRADGSSATTTATAIASSRARSAVAARTPPARAPSGSTRWPARSGAARRRTPAHHGRGRGQPDVGGLQRDQRAEQQPVHARARVVDVAGEDHPDRQRRDEQQPDRGVRVQPARALHALEHAAEADGAGERGQLRGHAPRPGDDEARERRGADRVRVERQPPQHHPGPEHARDHGQQQDLGDPALDVGAARSGIDRAVPPRRP